MVNTQIDTIAAISTSLTTQGIGIIRISGDKSFDIAKNILTNKNKNEISIVDHQIKYAFIYDKTKNIFLDEVIVLPMKAPKTYTKEDIIELQCHGGIKVVENILELVLKNGARLAEPGEFTKRAFLNGRIDLTEAESVADIIIAKNNFATAAAMTGIKGNIKNKIINIKNQILEEIARIEAALDDPEHLSLDGYKIELKNKIENTLKQLEKIIEDSQNGKILKDGINTVIIGQPNVGKSSLLNLLYGEERAIVTDIEGTTRDTIKETINLNGLTLNIIDTAGIRDKNKTDKIEQIGIDKALKEAKNSDLIIFVTDIEKYINNDKKFIEEDKKLFDEIKNLNKPIIKIYNKNDLSDNNSKNIKIENDSILFSTKTFDGYELLKQTIKNLFMKNKIDFNTEIILTNERQINSMRKCFDSLQNVLNAINDDISEDFLTIDLNDAYVHLANILGEEINDDVVNEIFSKFCMGK